MSKIHFLNHTSLLLEYDNNFLLLDPWLSGSLAFDSWKSHPPCWLNQEILSAFINSSENNVGIIISHAHDDHCDDSFLKKLSAGLVFFPKFSKKGGLRRLINLGLQNINEIDRDKPTRFGPFQISMKIIDHHSEDDAVFVITTNDYVFVHANDNSILFPPYLCDLIINESVGKKIYFASQTGIANGYPYCYPQFGDDGDIQAIAKEKTTRTIQVALNNAKNVGAKNFISYAAYTISTALLEQSPDGMGQLFPSPMNLQKLNLNYDSVNILDFIPGDVLSTEDDSIDRPFWTKTLGLEKLADQLKVELSETLPLYSEKQKHIAHLYQLDDQQKIYYLSNYLTRFYEYVLSLDDFWKEQILGKKLQIDVDDRFAVCIDLGTGKFLQPLVSLRPNKKIIIDLKTFLLLISGQYNFESLYVGHRAKFERWPSHIFNHALMMQLQVYGYIYQKRFVPLSLKSQNNAVDLSEGL